MLDQSYDTLARPVFLSGPVAGSLLFTAYTPFGPIGNASRGNNDATYFTWDPLQRLIAVMDDHTGTANDVIYGYTLNPASGAASIWRDNDLYAWQGHYAVSRSYATNGLNQYTAAGGASFAYDANGITVGITVPVY